MSQLLGLYSMGMTLGENVTVYLVTGAATLTTRDLQASGQGHSAEIGPVLDMGA